MKDRWNKYWGYFQGNSVHWSHALGPVKSHFCLRKLCWRHKTWKQGKRNSIICALRTGIKCRVGLKCTQIDGMKTLQCHHVSCFTDTRNDLPKLRHLEKAPGTKWVLSKCLLLLLFLLLSVRGVLSNSKAATYWIHARHGTALTGDGDFSHYWFALTFKITGSSPLA